MEMLYGNRRLIREWETGCMEEEDCCGLGGGEGEAGLHRQHTLFHLLRQKETRLQRMAQFLAMALLLLIALVVALLITVVLGGRCHHQSEESHNQPMTQPSIPFAVVNGGQQQQEDSKNPSAMLTAPTDNNHDGEYLKWESNIGNAFCHGGFNYSSGNLVVPRKGLYRVFLQITYEGKEDECPSDGELTLTNTVSVISDSYDSDMALLSTVETVNCSNEQWSKSIYTSGLFFLKANSRLRVTSSNHNLIGKKESQVFFGAELLPQ